jgi:hypothetical protein
MANILLMGWDMLHGNVLLHGWHMSDVSFYPTELVQYALLESVLGLHMTTAHVAAAMTYTLVVLLVVRLARGTASGPEALVRTLIAGGIMVAPQLSAGVYALDLAVGHIGTSVPLLLGWLLCRSPGERPPVSPDAWAGEPDGKSRHRTGAAGPGKGCGELPAAGADRVTSGARDWGRNGETGRRGGRRDGRRGWRVTRWWVPPLLAVILAWALVADPIVEITGIAPLALVACLRFGWPLVRRGGARPRPPDWYAAALAGAAVSAYLLAWVTQVLLRALGAYVVSPLPVRWRTFTELSAAAPALWRVLDLFGADFHGLRAGIPLLLAVAHLASVVLVIAALGLVAVRGRGGVPLVDQVLAVGITLNLALYLGTWASAQGAHEIAIVLPYAAALAGRMLAAPLRDAARTGAAAAATGLVSTGRVGAGRACTVAGVLVLCGYLAGFGYELTFPSSPPANSALASWLLAHGLRSGLATYWQSSSVTVDTANQVTVRAVTGSLSPYLWMADTAWYDPRLSQPDFVVLQEPAGSALARLRRRFGPATHEYHVDGCTILTWDRNLLSASLFVLFARAGPRHGTTMTGQRALRASQLGTEPIRWCQKCRGAPITSASALNSAAIEASSRAGLPRRVRTWTSSSVASAAWSSSLSSQRSSESASRSRPTTWPVSGSQ